MSSENQIAARRLRALLPTFTEVMVDCCRDLRTTVIVARATKMLREHIGALENPSASVVMRINVSGGAGSNAGSRQRPGLDMAEVSRRERAEQAANAESRERPGLNVAEFIRRERAEQAANADTSTRKRSAPVADLTSTDSENEERDGTSQQSRKPRRHKRRYRCEEDVKELLEKGNKESTDGYCVVEQCNNTIHTRGFCSGCYKAWLRASRERDAEHASAPDT